MKFQHFYIQRLYGNSASIIGVKEYYIPGTGWVRGRITGPRVQAIEEYLHEIWKQTNSMTTKLALIVSTKTGNSVSYFTLREVYGERVYMND